MDMVPQEHYDIYDAVYEEIKDMETEEATRIRKDIFRTLGIFQSPTFLEEMFSEHHIVDVCSSPHLFF